jgi:hypothetical protein
MTELSQGPLHLTDPPEDAPDRPARHFTESKARLTIGLCSRRRHTDAGEKKGPPRPDRTGFLLAHADADRKDLNLRDRLLPLRGSN